MEDVIEKVIFSEEQIREKVKELGARISKDYEGKKLFAVSVLKGASIFMADLTRQITVPLRMDFMAVSSYGDGFETSGEIKILRDIDADLSGYDVLIVEDIFDSGTTLSKLIPMLESRGANSVKVATLLEKPSRHRVSLPIAYRGFTVDDEFVVGYGLDYLDYYRNIPYVGVLKEEIYSK